MSWIQSHSLLSSSSSPPPLQSIPPTSSSSSKISPAILIIIIILAVIFFISGILQLLVRFLIKNNRSSSSVSESNRYPEMSSSDAFQRQLQQLFHLHDSGLDQAFIDALPVFLYKEIMGLKEPFDCAVCLCEFSEQDQLRLLPLCSHAFHINCIDTWLLSNSTCPLCRGNLYNHGLGIENPVFDHFDYLREEEYGGGGLSGSSGGGGGGDGQIQKPAENEIMNDQKRVFSVRLGKYRSSGNENGGVEKGGEGETSCSSSNLDSRRCYSMGSYQYVVADSELQVTAALLYPKRNGGGGGGSTSLRFVKEEDVEEGKKIKSKGESFSVSKIWQWSNNNNKKGKFPTTSSSETQLSSSYSVHVGLPRINPNQGT